MGLARAYQFRAGFGGDFWTAMDPDRHLENTKRESIKFGVGGKDVVMYRKFDSHRERFYVVVEPQELKEKVLDWIANKAAIATRNDTVTIILVAHGRKKCGSIRLGTELMTVKELEQATATFALGVHVNVVANSCYADFFIDQFQREGAPNRFMHSAAAKEQKSWVDRLSPSVRYRNTQFARGFVESLGSITMPRSRALSRGIETPTLQSHRDTVQAVTSNIKRNPKHSHDSEVYYTEAGNDWTNLMETILFRSFHDVAFDPTITNQRRRITGYASIANLVSPPENPDPATISTCLSVIELEVSYVTLDPPSDEIVMSVSCRSDESRRQNLLSIMKELYWRATKQMAICHVFCILVKYQLADISALTLPVDYNTTSKMISEVCNDLQCFPLLDELDNVPADCSFGMFEQPVSWLATMLCRSTPHLNAAFSIMNHSKFLGKLDINEVNKLNERRMGERKKAQVEPQEASSRRPYHFETDHLAGCGDSNESDRIGLILPSGIRNADVVEFYVQVQNRFELIELAFKRYFRLTDEDLKAAAREEYCNRSECDMSLVSSDVDDLE